MKNLILLVVVTASVVILYSCSDSSNGDKGVPNDSLTVKVEFTDAGDASVYTYECTKGDTIRVECPNGSYYSYVVCEEGETVSISCSDTIHNPTFGIPVYNPLHPEQIKYVRSDTVH